MVETIIRIVMDCDSIAFCALCQISTKSSFAFTFAKQLRGKPIEIPVSKVDLVHLRNQMDDLDTFFWGLEIEITEAQSFFAEIVDRY